MAKQSAVGKDVDSLLTTASTLGQLSDVDALPNNTSTFLRGDGQFAAPPGGAAIWTAWPGTFTATPASTSTITLTQDVTATIKPGYPLKYTIGGTVYYGIVKTITANLLTVQGAPLSGDVTALNYGDPVRAVQMVLFIPGYYEDADYTTLIATALGQQLLWMQAPAYLVHFRAKTRIADGSSDGRINVRIGGNDVSTSNSNEGLTLAGTGWYLTEVDISTANYDIAYGDVIELNANKGTGGDAQELSIELVFVVP